MSKNKGEKKAKIRPAAVPVVNTTKESTPDSSTVAVGGGGLTFSSQTLLWIAGGFGLMLLGMLLMTGGQMPSPDVWDEDIIYSFRRITLAPIVILAGIGVVIYAIFKK